jgi:hypothetical protein
MIMKRTLASLALTLFVGGSMLVGCGPDTKNTSSGNPPSGPIALENLSQALAQSYCELAFSCCTAMEQAVIFEDLNMVPKTAEECTASSKEFYDSLVLADIKASVDAGRVKYDGALAATCLDKIEGQCNSLATGGVGGDAECNAVFVGLVADGGDCVDSQDCATKDSFCTKAQGAMMGKCEAPAKEGESCATTFCADGLVCDFGAMTQTCIKPIADGQMCTSDFSCISEYCDSATGTCSQPKPVGSDCSSPQACKDSYCDFQTSKCTALKADGEACMFFDECQSGDCDQDTMMCTPVTPAPQCDGI